MAIYEIKPDGIHNLKETTFAHAGLKERADLQRLLNERIEVISPDTLVIAEEFGEWEESRRRIDLLGIDKDANLVVVELKRSEDGGHMELQAIRYAAMVSTMTFARAVEVYEDSLAKHGKDIRAEEAILEFLGWDEADEGSFAQAVRIILVSADFSKELSTSAMWLNEQGLDIRCVRIKPYTDGQRVLVDVQQVIPLPAAQDYIISIREKSGAERSDRTGKVARHQLRREFWAGLLERINKRSDIYKGISPSNDNWLNAGTGVSGVVYSLIVRLFDTDVKLSLEGLNHINKAGFDYLKSRQAAIEKTFGEPLAWERCDDLKKSYLYKAFSLGGIHTDKSEWPKIHDAMIDAVLRLEKAIAPHIEGLRRVMASARQL